MKKKTLTLFGCLIAVAAAGQEEFSPIEKLEQRTELLESTVKKLQKLQVSGYIQTQFQYAETDADGINLKVGSTRNDRTDLSGFNRFGVRRGRIKFTYEEGLVTGVFQPDFTEKGLSFKDVYLSVKDPFVGTNSLKAGIFDRPFGHEIAYSSSRRESPERSRIVQSLFPDERDLGAMLTLQPAATSAWNILKLEAGLFAGNGIRAEIDSRLDFIGRLSVNKTIGSDMAFGAGVSAYIGGVYQGDSSVYVMKNKAFELESKRGENIGKFAKRHYFGFDAQFSVMSAAGLTQLRAEYIFGKHPGSKAAAYDFKFTALPQQPTYMRNISGGYVILAQDLGATPFSVVAKFDWYDPNTDISGNEISTSGEIMKSTIGLGAIWRINNALRLTAYYDMVQNETTDKLKNTVDDNGKITAYGYDSNRKDNVFTLRLQYKF